jgi:hypothetical protein
MGLGNNVNTDFKNKNYKKHVSHVLLVLEMKNSRVDEWAQTDHLFGFQWSELLSSP